MKRLSRNLKIAAGLYLAAIPFAWIHFPTYCVLWIAGLCFAEVDKRQEGERFKKRYHRLMRERGDL